MNRTMLELKSCLIQAKPTHHFRYESNHVGIEIIPTLQETISRVEYESNHVGIEIFADGEGTNDGTVYESNHVGIEMFF